MIGVLLHSHHNERAKKCSINYILKFDHFNPSTSLETVVRVPSEVAPLSSLVVSMYMSEQDAAPCWTHIVHAAASSPVCHSPVSNPVLPSLSSTSGNSQAAPSSSDHSRGGCPGGPAPLASPFAFYKAASNPFPPPFGSGSSTTPAASSAPVGNSRPATIMPLFFLVPIS